MHIDNKINGVITPILMATYENAIDDEPTPGSGNLVTSGGVSAALENLPMSSGESIRKIVKSWLTITHT